MTNSFGDFAKAKMFLVIGSNMTEAHPVAATFVKNAVLKGAPLFVVDPRQTALADFAELHIPIKVGSDVAFLNGLMNVLITEDLYDKAFVEARCSGFEELKAKVMEYPARTGGRDLRRERGHDPRCGQAARLRQARHALYTLGITEHTCGINNVLSCANLQMLLGNVGLECGGVNPLRGQNNVQGACDMGALPNVFPGYQRVDNAEARAKFEKAWGVTSLPDKPGLMIPQMIEGLPSGKIKAFWIFGENLANTEPDIRHVEHCLESAEFIVCHDIFPTETTRFAHVVFPAAAWSENDGTFTNSERRISRVRKVSHPPGEAKPNWWIFREIARRMGHKWLSKSAREIWDNEVSVLAPSMAGVKYSRIEGNGLQWPCTSRGAPGNVHSPQGPLHLRHGRPDPRGMDPACGSGRQPIPAGLEHRPQALSLSHAHPDRARRRPQRSPGRGDGGHLPLDAAALGIEHGEMIRVASRRGEVKVKANVSDRIPEGVVWMAFHFREACANWLTNPAFDPVSQTAEYKACAVRIEKT